MDLNLTSLPTPPSVQPSDVTYSSNYSSTTLSPQINVTLACSVPGFLMLLAYVCWLIIFPYFRRNWNPRRKMMSCVHIETVALLIFLFAYRMPCVFHIFTHYNRYLEKNNYPYLVVPICIVAMIIIVRAARYYSKRITRPEDFDTETLLIVEPSEFYEETLNDEENVSESTRQGIFARGDYQSIEGQEGCKNPNNIPRLKETKTTLNFLVFFSQLSLIFVIVNPDSCFPEDPLPRFFLCAVHVGHMASVLHKRIMYGNMKTIYIVAAFVVLMLASNVCMFHAYPTHNPTKVGIILVLEIFSGAVVLYVAIWRILLRYIPTKSELIRTVSACLIYLALTICTVAMGMMKLKIGGSLSKCV